MEPPRASFSAVGEAGGFGAGPPWSGYLFAAKKLLQGARVLASSGSEQSEAHTLVAGFIAETLLKAAIIRSGVTSRDVRSGAKKHNLVELWSRASEYVPQLSGPAPAWVQKLNVFHDSPYVVRYMADVNAYVLPLVSEVQHGVEQLLEVVASYVAAQSAA